MNREKLYTIRAKLLIPIEELSKVKMNDPVINRDIGIDEKKYIQTYRVIKQLFPDDKTRPDAVAFVCWVSLMYLFEEMKKLGDDWDAFYKTMLLNKAEARNAIRLVIVNPDLVLAVLDEKVPKIEEQGWFLRIGMLCADVMLADALGERLPMEKLIKAAKPYIDEPFDDPKPFFIG